MITIEKFIEEKSKDKDFLNRYQNEVIRVDCLHILSNKILECLFFIKTKVTYKGSTENVLNKHKFKKI